MPEQLLGLLWPEVAAEAAPSCTRGHKVTIRETGFRLAPDLESQSLTQITAIYAALAKDAKRIDSSTMF